MIVYQGTSAHYHKSILEEGLIPQRHRKHVYVTTNYDKAIEYSLIWTGGLIWEEQRAIELKEKDFFFMVSHGIIITLDIPEELLIIDDYNLESEPNQYKILGNVSESYITNIEEVYFDEYSDHIDDEEFQSNLITARSKLVGVSQWGDD
ncbi:hypothetical protein JYK21_01170 [Ralstonia pickettii]|nr:hypothetical protein [Ralstonia pickettii]